MADISNITVSVEGVDTVCEIKDKVARNDIAVNRTTLGYTTKNLLKITTASKSGNGVTITVNDDKSITVNGTATSAGVYATIGEADVIAGNKYILNGGAGSGSTYGIYTENYGTVLNFGSDNVYIPDTTGKAIFLVFVRPNVTISNIIFKPMLRDADIINDTYEPYFDNVDTRLIEDKSNIAINKSTLGYIRKNLLKNKATTLTVNGITFTVNDDKSVTLNGTSTAQADFYLRGAWGSTSEILQKNKYIASIGVSQSSTFNGVVMHCINNTTSIGSPSCNYPSLVVNGAITAVYISVSKGYTFSNYKLYPMIRYADITDSTYEPYQPSVQEINAHIIDKTQKNLLDVINTSQDIEGATYNVNSDKTITFSRVTAGNQSAFHLNSKNAAFMPNKYAGCLLSGCTSGSNSTYGLVAMYSNDGTNWANENWNFTSPVKILDYPYINIALVIRKNTTVSNVTVKPMICTEADYNISTEYTPYAPTNAELADRDSYSISVSGKSTSAAISYSGVPTLICLTPSESVSSGGGLYLINSVGTAVYLIDKTGIVVNTNTTNQTFTITNNTASTYDVYISCAYKKE